MIYKKYVVIGSVLTISLASGIALAATNSNTPTKSKDTVQSVTVEHKNDTTGTPITVESTTVDPVVPTPQPQAAAPVITTPAPVVTNPLDTFKQDVTAQVQTFASSFATLYAPDVPTFIDNQLRCAMRGVDDTTDQATLDAKLSYFSPYQDSGKTWYRFYTGGCQPVLTHW